MAAYLRKSQAPIQHGWGGAPPGAEELLGMVAAGETEPFLSWMWPLAGRPCPVDGPTPVCITGSANWKQWLFLKQILESRHEVGRKRGHGGEIQVQNELGAERWEWVRSKYMAYICETLQRQTK